MTASGQFSLEPRAFPLCLASPQCPTEQRATCRCLMDHLAAQSRDDATATAHLLALADSRAAVNRVRTALATGSAQLREADKNARGALRKCDGFLGQGKILEARTAITTLSERHHADGPYDRRQRLIPGGLATARVLIVLAAVFDTAFLGQVFGLLISAPADGRLRALFTVIAYLPGAVLAGALLLAGTWLGEAVERWRDARDGRPKAHAVPRAFWILPIGFLLLVLFTVGTVAWARPQFTQRLAEAAELLQTTTNRVGAPPQEGAGFVPSWVVVLLLLMLSLTAIAATVVESNSYARWAESADKVLKTAAKSGEELIAAAEEKVALHEQRWAELRGQVFTLISEIEDLWQAAAKHCGSGVGAADSGAHTDGPIGGNSAPLVRYTPFPPPAFGTVLDAGLTLERFSPDTNREHLRELTSTLRSHWATPTSGRST